MGEVNVSHRLDTGYLNSKILRGQRLRNFMEIRGVAVRTGAQQRLRQPPQRIDTGNLISSIQMRTFRRRGAPVVRIGTDVEYALFVHEGTRPHIIRSHGSWPLRNRRTGEVFGRRVNHPGTQANPFLVDGLKRGMSLFR